MTYGNPDYGYLFFVVLGVIIFLIWASRRRRTLMEHFVEGPLLDRMLPDFSLKGKRFKQVLILLAMALSVFALMRPQWGFRWEEVKRRGLDILVAMDTSKSMLARDVKPDRLERSKLAVRDMVKKLKGDRIGLIAFAGTAFLQCPLTVDYSGFLLALDDLDTSTIPRGGTAITSAINKAIEVFKGPEKKYKVLIIITDGEDHEGDPVKAAKRAQKEGIKIFCIGVGTQKGELIPVRDEWGRRSFMKDREGDVIKSALNEEILQAIALHTGGGYIHARGAEFGLDLMYDQKISRLEKRDIESKLRRRYQERFQIFLSFALLLLFLEPLVSERR